tara:strand:+ start:701 stop:910 length:210 start_codon:yes stop_codon:yes gene_type:complete
MDGYKMDKRRSITPLEDRVSYGENFIDNDEVNILEILKMYADYHSIFLIKYIAKNEGININELIPYLFK